MSVQSLYESVSANIGKVILGKKETIEMVICSLLANGHILLEDVPGTGKTMLVRALAASIGGEQKRVQFTPDLLPSDITGIHYYHQNTGEFLLRRGPIFTNLFLADEINRATPRTQAALLECMAERQVTLDGETLSLPEVFMAMATMNPLDFQGTFPLPEAQIDRFMMKLHMGYPDIESERHIVDQITSGVHATMPNSVATVADIMTARSEIDKVHVSEQVRDYIVRLVIATREHEKIKLGVSPRGVVALTKASRAFAAMHGRDYVMPDDVKALAVPVLSHRLILQLQSSRGKSETGENIIEYLLTKVPVSLI